jgi:hypothetical protein
MKKTHRVSRILFTFLIIPLLAACAGAATTQAPLSTATALPTKAPPPTIVPSATANATATTAPTLKASPSATPTAEPIQPLTWTGKNRPLLMAHYMPWYQAPPVSASFGFHWTMNHFSPKQNADGAWQNLASYYTPLTGPYDSSDDAVLEYQVLLMKLSGIDGVIVDWYGTENYNDYATINSSTAHLFKAIQKAGLKFVICYEDATIRVMLNDGHITKEKAVAQAQKDMRYLQDTWFKDPAYVKFNNQPVLLNFGPQYFKSSDDWKAIFTGLTAQPFLITEDQPLMPAATSGFPWPPMTGAPLSQDALKTYLADFYQKGVDFGFTYIVGSAFPGFHDIYKEAGTGDGYGILDAQNGRTFNITLQEALNHNPNMIQLVTWNDYGEGTIIEPTVEFGYQYLEMVQEARKVTSDGKFTQSADDLRLPLQWYQLRVKHAGDAALVAKLDQAFKNIVAGDVKAASTLLQSVQ